MNNLIKSFAARIGDLFNKFGLGNNHIIGLSFFQRIHNISIHGNNNTILVKSKLGKGVRIVIYGDNHNLTIESGVNFKNGLIWFEDQCCSIYIKRNTTIESAVLSVAENGTKISIGADCMLSKDIRISTSDAHSVIDILSGKRLNFASDVILEDHVWVCNGSSINKGCIIGHDCIIAGKSVVTHSVEHNCIAAGIPAKIVKTGISWYRQRI